MLANTFISCKKYNNTCCCIYFEFTCQTFPLLEKAIKFLDINLIVKKDFYLTGLKNS